VSSASSEQPAGREPKGASAEPWRQRVKVKKACALRTNLEGTNRRHPDSAAAAGAFGLEPSVHVRRTRIGSILPSPTRGSPTTGTEGVNDLGDGDDRGVAMVHRFTVHMADAQTTLEEFGDWRKWSRTRHEDLRLPTRSIGRKKYRLV